MHLPRSALLLACGLAVAPVPAPAADRPPRLVRVDLTTGVTPEALLQAGLDVVEVRRGSHCLILEWPHDRATVVSLGARFEVLDEDPAGTAERRARTEMEARPRPRPERVPSATRPDGIFRIESLPPVGSGSMGGYWTLAEVKTKLDQLVAGDANDVVADKLDTLGYSSGYPYPSAGNQRPIWGLKLGKSVAGPDTRPAAFFNSLTHAREPAGMQALFYFVDDLLARYGTDPTATYLLDHRQIYVVPVVNPDGYKYNQDTNPGGGGMWRKNARDNNGNGVFETSQDGVDLNRNYGHQWGLNDVGSSGSPGASTYRGPSAFSEPETQRQRDVVALLQPRTGLSFHTYSDLLIHPWGHTAQATEDSAAFHEWSDDMALGNGYQSGQAPRILYEVNGEFTDWCYGDTQLKPRAYLWTPEVGGPADWFWPAPSRIVPLAEENLRACYYAAAIAGPHVRVESFAVSGGALNQGSIAHLSLRARNKGVSGSAGPGLTATLATLSAGANVIQGSASFPTLGPRESGDALGGATLVVAADDTVTLGRLLRFRVDFSAPDGYFSRDTIEIFCGTPTVLFADDANSGTGSWVGGWGIESADPARPGPHFSDSPGALYKNNANNVFRLDPTLDLSGAVHAYALFETRWEFESDYDCGAVEASLGGTSWTPLSGRGTSLGRSGGVQPVGQPVYDGARRNWMPERVDLSPFAGPAGTAVMLRFRVLSDAGVQFDGFRMDSLRIVTFYPAAQPAPVAVGGGSRPAALELAPPFPNPARGRARLSFALPRQAEVRLEVFDPQGRRVRTLMAGRFPGGRYQGGWDLKDESGTRVAPGIYLVRLSGSEGSLTRRLVALL